MSLIDQAKEQMAKTVENTKENFSGIRTGRANPALLNGITVDYYGAPTPIKAVASIGVPEPRTLSVTPFDASQAGAVEKALRNSPRIVVRNTSSSPRARPRMARSPCATFAVRPRKPSTRPSRTARWVRTKAIAC